MFLFHSFESNVISVKSDCRYIISPNLLQLYSTHVYLTTSFFHLRYNTRSIYFIPDQVRRRLQYRRSAFLCIHLHNILILRKNY